MTAKSPLHPLLVLSAIHSLPHLCGPLSLFTCTTAIRPSHCSVCIISESHPVYTRTRAGCVFPAFKEVQEANGPHLAEIDEHTPNSRVFRIYAGMVQE